MVPNRAFISHMHAVRKAVSDADSATRRSSEHCRWTDRVLVKPVTINGFCVRLLLLHVRRRCVQEGVDLL